MEYEPLKKQLRRLVSKSVILRKGLYRILGVMFLREWYVKQAIRRLDIDNKENLDILDAGAGFGQYSYFCSSRFHNAHILGLEIEPEHVRDGNVFTEKADIHNLRFQEGDLTELADQNRFDLILCVDVLEHIEDDQRLLKVFTDALKSGGYLVISTPSLYRKHAEDGDFVGEHYREGYSEEDMTGKLETAGLNLEELIYGYGFWGDLSWRLGIRNTMKLAGHGFPGKFLGLIYLTLMMPLVLSLMGMDFIWKNNRGTGMVVVATKP